MNRPSAQHGSFTITRMLKAPPAAVFNAFADKEAKARWFAPPVEWSDVIREQDFRIGGRDRAFGRWPDGRTSDFRAEYWDIVEKTRIVYVYEMYMNGAKISVSLATVTFEQADDGTKLTVTEQGAFLDGYDDAGSRERGTAFLIDRLAETLRPTPE